MDSEEPRRETNYELEERLRMERAKKRYLEQHPFHRDREDINPIDVVIELSKEGFANNEAAEFKLEKAFLGSRMDIKATATEFLCKKLEANFDFVHNTKLGYLIIERGSFETWLKLRDELKAEKEKNANQSKEALALENDIREWKAANDNNEKALTSTRAIRDKLKSRLDELSKEKENLPIEIKGLKEKLLTIRADLEKGRQEGSTLNEEVSKAEKELKDIQAENFLKINNLQVRKKALEREKILTPLDILNDNNARLRAELDEIKSHPIYARYQEETSISRRLLNGFGWFLGYGLFFWAAIWIYDLIF